MLQHLVLAAIDLAPQVAEPEPHGVRRQFLGDANVAARAAGLGRRFHVDGDDRVGACVAQLEDQRLRTPAGREVEVDPVAIARVSGHAVSRRLREPGIVVIDQLGSGDVDRTLPRSTAAWGRALAVDLGRRLEGDLHPRFLGQSALQVSPGVDDRAVPDHVDRVDRGRSADPAVDAAHGGVLLAGAHTGAVERRLEEDPLAGRRVRGPVAERVEDRVRVVLRRVDGGQTAQLPVAGPGVAGMAVVVVGGADEADFEAVLQVLVAEPVEGAVA